MKDHGIPTSRIGVALRICVEQIDNAALADHRIVVEILLKPFPELERKFVKRLIAIEQIIRADDRRITPDIAAANIAFFEHSDLGLAEFFGKIIRGSEPVSAATNDKDIIGRLWLWVAPGGRPPFVACQRLANNSPS